LSRFFFFFLLLIALCAGWTVWYATPAGLGLTNDSAAYIGGARSILAGTGYSDIWLDSPREPITHYPPLLSLTMSAMSMLTGLDPYRAARALHILLFALNAGFMGLLGLQMTRSPLAGLGLALLFATNADLLRIHAQVLSEPLFLFLSLASFLTFSIAIERQFPPKPNPEKLNTGGYWSRMTEYWNLNAEHWLLITGLLTGLAVLTRYSGLALVATFLAAIFLLSWQARFKQIAFFLGGVFPPIAAWFIRNSLLADSATNRIVQFNPIELSNIRIGLWNTAHFLLPIPVGAEWLFKSGMLTVLLALFGLGLLLWLIFHAWQLLFSSAPAAATHTNPLVFATSLYIVGYLGAMLFSMSFFDASTKFQPRILAPLYVSWLMILVAGLQFLRKWVWFGAPLAAVLAVCTLSISGLNVSPSILKLREMEGLGYASWRWRQAEVLAYLRTLPADIAIYSNSPPAIYHVTGRASRVIPTPFNPVSGLPRSGYEQALTEMRDELLSGRAVLVLFDVSDIEDAFGEEIALQFDGLTLLLKAQGHVLYGIAERK